MNTAREKNFEDDLTGYLEEAGGEDFTVKGASQEGDEHGEGVDTGADGEAGGGDRKPVAGAGDDAAGDRGPSGKGTEPGAQPASVEGQKFTADKRGNIVDEQGRIVARAGMERRLHDTAQKARQENLQLRTELDRYRQIAERNQALDGLPARYGLSNEDVAQTLGMMAEFKTNPVGVVQRLIAETIKNGHDLSDIVGEEAKGFIQTTAIQRMLEERLGPLERQEQQQRQQQQVSQEIERSFNNFTTKYPNATLHEGALVKIMQQSAEPGEHPSVSAERAYLILENWCARNGFDVNYPLKPQVEERMAQHQNRQQGARGEDTQQPRRPRPMPQGRTQEREVTDQHEVADATATWDEIVRAAMG